MDQIDSIFPNVCDLDERIEVNLAQGMTLEEVKKDTINLIRDFEMTICRQQIQIQIYKNLIHRIDERIEGV